jgi:hypothetical protein
MLRFAYTFPVRVFRNLLFLAAVAAPGLSLGQQPLPAFRWTPGAPGCTLGRASDGRYYYRYSTAIYDLSVGIDPQELEKIPYRAVPMISILVSLKNKGNAKLEFLQNRYTLEFVKHSHLIQSSADPDAIVRGIQQRIQGANNEAAYQIKKHSEQREQKQGQLQVWLKTQTEMMDFVSTQGLRPTVLDAANASASGWVFFWARNRWIGPWQKPEELILRMPVADQIIELPFSLPPEPGKVELRHRSGQ